MLTSVHVADDHELFALFVFPVRIGLEMAQRRSHTHVGLLLPVHLRTGDQRRLGSIRVLHDGQFSLYQYRNRGELGGVFNLCRAANQVPNLKIALTRESIPDLASLIV